MSRREILGDRDKKLFDLLYQFKVATVDDIRALVFDNIGKCHVYRRLKELDQMGYIQRVLCQKNMMYLTAYSLTRSAFKKLLPEPKANLARDEYLSDKIEHDLGLLAIYRRLIQSPRIESFLTENTLKANSSEIDTYGIKDSIKHHPDAILIDQTSKGRYFLPLECELSVKKRFRYETKLMRYYQTETIPAVIYICGDDKVKRVISQTEEKYCKGYRPKVFYGILDQWPSPPAQLVLENRKGGQLIF